MEMGISISAHFTALIQHASINSSYSLTKGKRVVFKRNTKFQDVCKLVHAPSFELLSSPFPHLARREMASGGSHPTRGKALHF